jgi:hypothetical protein
LKKFTLLFSATVIFYFLTIPNIIFSQNVFPDWHESIIEWTTAGYDTFYSKSNNSSTLAWAETYVLQTYNLMYEVDADTIWLHKLAKHGYDIMGSARDVPEDTSVAYDPRIADGFLGWGTDHYSDDGKYTEYLVHEGHFSTELARFVLKIYQNDELYTYFGTRADSLLHFLEKNVAAKWYSVWDSNYVSNPDNVMDGEYPRWAGSQNLDIIPVNQYTAFGNFLLELSQISKTSHYSPYNTDFLPWYQRVVSDMAAEFRSGMHYMPDINAYTWKYSKYCCENDVSHSAIDVMFAYECYLNGIEFNTIDMQRIANLYVKHLWKNPKNVWNAEVWDFFDQDESSGYYDRDTRKWGIYALYIPWIGGIQSGIYRSYAVAGKYGSPQASGIATLVWINKYALPLTSAVDIKMVEKNGDGDNLADPGEELNLFIGVANWGIKTIDSVAVTIESDDERIEIVNGNSQYPPIACMDTVTAESDTFLIKIKDDITSGGKIPISIAMRYKDKTVIDTLFILINPVKVLLVDDDGGTDFEKYYIKGVLDSISTYIIWDITTRGTPSPYLQKYEEVVWFTGDDSVNTLTNDDREGLKLFMDNGGKFILFSSKVQDDLLENEQPDSSFFENYLHAYSSNYMMENDFFTLKNVDPRIYPSIYMSVTPHNNHLFRAISQKPESGILMEYFFGGGSPAGIYTLSPHRMAYITFGVENVKDGMDEAAQMERRRIFLSGIMGILDETTAIKSEINNVPEEFQLSAHPNPFNSQITFTFMHPQAQTTYLTIYDIRGKRIKSFTVKNKSVLQWNGMNENGVYTGSGVYLVRVQNGSAVKTYKIVQIK